MYYPFEKYGYSDTNFIIDAENWHMAAKISNDGLWRVTYGDEQGLSTEELLARQPAKFERILPSHPKSGNEYGLVSISPYKVHQRRVKSMRVGRICLAGDAAHCKCRISEQWCRPGSLRLKPLFAFFVFYHCLGEPCRADYHSVCNPFGGLGLTGGLVDAGALYDCLSGIIEGNADESILDKYSEVRLGAFKSYVDPISTNNFLLLQRDSRDPTLLEDPFILAAKRTANDVEFSKKFQTLSLQMRVDLTDFFSSA